MRDVAFSILATFDLHIVKDLICLIFYFVIVGQGLVDLPVCHREDLVGFLVRFWGVWGRPNESLLDPTNFASRLFELFLDQA